MKPLSAQQRSELELATSTFQKALPESAGVEYLMGRGLTGRTAQTFRLGFVPEGIEGWEKFAGMVSIPNVNSSGIVVGMKFRDLAPDAKPKYTGRSGEAKRLYNTAAFATATEVIAVTEGEFDAMVVTQCGIPSVSVPSGAQSWKAHHTRMFAGFSRVALVIDNDKPGHELRLKLVDLLQNAVVIDLPVETKDVNDLLVNEGEAAVRALLSTSTQED